MENFFLELQFKRVIYIFSSLQKLSLCQDAGAIGKQIKDGVRLMGRGADEIKWPIHLEVTLRSKYTS